MDVGYPGTYRVGVWLRCVPAQAHCLRLDVRRKITAPT